MPAKKKEPTVSKKKTEKKTRRATPNPRSNSPVAAKLRQQRQQALRETLAGRTYLSQIAKAYYELLELDQDLKEYKLKATIGGRTALSQKIAVMEARHKVLKTMIDTNFRRLNKVLPDLKSVELTGDEDNPLTQMAEAFRELLAK